MRTRTGVAAVRKPVPVTLGLAVMILSGAMTLAGAKLNEALLDVMFNPSQRTTQPERQQADSTDPLLA